MSEENKIDKETYAIAIRIVNEIWDDISGRSGGDSFLDECDDDIQEEMQQTWRDIILNQIAKYK